LELGSVLHQHFIVDHSSRAFLEFRDHIGTIGVTNKNLLFIFSLYLNFLGFSNQINGVTSVSVETVGVT
jgi:hypothetical protein